MKVHLRADSINEEHIRVTVFLNGANCGQLCMRKQEAHNFYQILSIGCKEPVDDFVATGQWITKDEKESLSPGA